MQTQLILAFVFSFITFQTCAQPWQLSRDRKEVEVYTRKAEGSSIKDSKSVMTVNGTPEQALKLLMNGDDHAQWMDRVVKSRLLAVNSETDFVVYYEASAPWPVSHRDVISHYTVKKSPSGKIELNIIGKPAYIPEKEGIVRVHDQKSQWVFTPLEGGRMKVVFFNHTDPAGHIPAWLANSASTDNPFNTMVAFRDLIEGR